MYHQPLRCSMITSGSYFTDKEHKQALIHAVGSWKGTRFKHGKMVKGRAVDCALYVASCLVETGVFSGIEYEFVPRQWAAHTDREVLLDGYRAQFERRMTEGLHAVELPPQDCSEFGDILFFTTGKYGVSNHCALKLDGIYMTCALEKRGICVMELSEVWKTRMTHVFRIKTNG